MKNKKETYQEKKDRLIEMSLEAKMLKKYLGLENNTINQILIDHFYNDKKDGSLIFKSYKKWQDAGYNVKKGEKAYLFWSRKRKAKEKEVEGKPEEDNNTRTGTGTGTGTQPQEDEETDYSYYTLAYLFSNKQVIPILDKSLLN